MSTPSTHRSAVVVFETMFGNTAKVADAVARGLEREGLAVACSDVRSTRPWHDVEADLLVIGAPTHYFSLSVSGTREDAARRGAPGDRARVGMREWLGAPAPRSPMAVFDTRLRAYSHIPVAGAQRAARLVARGGVEVVGVPTGFLVETTTGPLVEGELERAEAWGRSLAGEILRADAGSVPSRA